MDELPQLINVIRGEMSLVGPRPERPEYVDLFNVQIARYGDRHRVKAGITGWAQVHGLRGQTSIADRAEWDNFYIENWSLWLDWKILAMTVGAVIALLAVPLVLALGRGKPAEPVAAASSAATNDELGLGIRAAMFRSEAGIASTCARYPTPTSLNASR